MSIKGRFVWYDLMTNDVKGAQAFYTETIGWKTEGWEQGDYTMWKAGDTMLGGVMELPPELAQGGVPPHWIAYVAVDDVDAAAKRATELGGKIHKPGTDIPEVGRFAVVADPQGAVIALYRSKDASQMTAPDRQAPGLVGWHELNTTDYESSWKFYSQLFGWEHTSAMDMGEGLGQYFMFRHGDDAKDASMGGMSNVAKSMNMPPHWLYYFNVDAIDGAIDRIKSKGGKILNGPMEVPGGGKIAQCMDPQGGAFAVFAMK